MASFLNQPSDFSFSATQHGRMSFLLQHTAQPVQPVVQQQRVAAPQHSFPPLPTSEVLRCLGDLGVSIGKEELLRPENHRDTIRRLLEYMVEITLGVTREELAQPAFAGLSAINYPELHEESIPFLNLLRNVSRMMEVCEIHDFSLRDLLMPSAARLNKQLSGILNFVKFREEKLLLLSELSGNREEALHVLSQAQEKNETLNNRLHLLHEQTQEEGEQIHALERDIAAFEAHLSELRREEHGLDGENASLAQRVAEHEQRIAQSLAQSDELQGATRRLSSQIVSSPEKFRKQIIDVAQTLQQEQRDAKAAEKKCKELATWLGNLDEAHLEVSSALESIEEVRAEVERQKSLITEVDAHRQHLASQRQAMQELQQNALQFQRQVQRADEKLVALRKQTALRAQEAQKNIDDLHLQLVEAEAFRLQVKGKVERVESEATRLEKEIDAAHSVQDQELLDIKNAYAKLERKVVQHLQSLRRTLDGQSAPRSPMNVA